MCTTQMIVENGPHPLAPDPPEDGAWVHPIVAGRSQGEDDSGNEQVTVVDISGLSSQSDQGAASVGCSQPFSLFLQQGAIIRSGSQVPTFGVYFALADCFDDLPVACCGVYRPDRPADPPNVITPR